MLQFDEIAHSYTWNGKIVPSVTKILKPLQDFGAIPPAVLAAKADLGTRVHLATELDDAGTLDEATITDDVRPYLEAWRQFKRVNDPMVVMSEQRVYHPLGYAGTLDRVLFLRDEEWLVDLKTSAEVPLSAGPQTAAYAHALGQPDIKRAALLLRPDGTYHWAPLNNPTDWAAFQSCLVIHRYKEQAHV